MRLLRPILFCLAGFEASLTEAFVVPRKQSLARTTMTLIGRRRAGNDDDDADADADSVKQQKDSTGLPLLPSFGASSQSFFDPFDGTLPHLQKPQENHVRSDDDDANAKQYVANRKFELQYTCNICETRNCHKVSRVAYRKGVVIATCKGCGSQHLIADNLGFTNLWNEKEEGNIEEYFANQGMQEKVNRVSKDVFDLEKVLGFDTDSGSIVGDDGEPAME